MKTDGQPADWAAVVRDSRAFEEAFGFGPGEFQSE